MKRIGNCPWCKSEMWLPDELYQAAVRSPQIAFYCAYGHKQHFSIEGIKKYWEDKAKPAQPAIQPTYEATNIIIFKGKGHEAQQHS